MQNQRKIIDEKIACATVPQVRIKPFPVAALALAWILGVGTLDGGDKLPRPGGVTVEPGLPVAGNGPAPAPEAAAQAIIAKLKAARVEASALKTGGFKVTFPFTADLNEDTWKTLESLPDLKEVFLGASDFNDDHLARICKFESIEAVTVHWGARKVTSAGLLAIARLPNLRQLRLSIKYSASDLLSALASSGRLQSLTVNGPEPLSDQDIKVIGKMTELRELTVNLVWVPKFTSQDFVQLYGLRHLQNLTFGQMVLPYKDGLEHLKRLNLKSLQLNDCYITEADFAKLKAALPGVLIERAGLNDSAVKKYNDLLEQYKKSGLPKYFTD